MRKQRIEIVLIVILCFFSFYLWKKLMFDFFSSFDFPVSRKEAIETAKDYLSQYKIDLSNYNVCAVFDNAVISDIYLQKTLGIKKQEEFLKKYKFEIFSWQVRFFKEKDKEEFIFKISPKNKEILSFYHVIEDTESRPLIDKESAKAKAERFLSEFFGIDFKDYIFHEENVLKYDNRLDYIFSWERKDVYIPWIKKGGAKLLIGVTISGDEIRGFYRNVLDIPDEFLRYIEGEEILRSILSAIGMVFCVIFIIFATAIILRRKITLITKKIRNWYVGLAIFLFLISVIDYFNNFQSVLMNYPTSSSFVHYVIIQLFNMLFYLFFLSVFIILPGLSAEKIREENYPQRNLLSFSVYLNCGFLNRAVSKSISLGYLWAGIILGIQGVLIYLGRRYWGLWLERIHLSQLSSAYIPLLSSFVVGCKAGLTEEIVFRLFGINLFKRYLKNNFLAIIITSFIWSLGHVHYFIFPVWFRIIEVSILGIILGGVFLRYGIVTAIVTHYLFDVFWFSIFHLFSVHNVGMGFVFFMPLIFGLLCFLKNKEFSSPVGEIFSEAEKYNLEILMTFLKERINREDPDKIKEKLIKYGWEPSLVEEAFKNLGL